MAGFGFSEPYGISAKGVAGNAVDIFYPVSDYDRWRDDNLNRTKQGYPGTIESQIFLVSTTPNHYFGEAYASKHIARFGFDSWCERCEFKRPPTDRTKLRNRANPIVYSLMGKEVASQLQKAITTRIFGKWAEPDIVAYHHTSKRWLFLEVKLFHPNGKCGDSPKPHQLQSLAILQAVVPNSLSYVVAVKPESMSSKGIS